ncbi:Serine/threonine-protein kinase PknB [Polystyrenella longa]|uniref:non-specific serine/threonine protein kinase n=1 Tax=Polystyrenella longa TaxID=2528007 RepID=A0A518CN24_9PLAN|nr:serine/threonine-protein kinase [Polystyrenella longa]QDU80625.1 Serine/threonine-protein kinase PknB [Polystyrenella longa]
MSNQQVHCDDMQLNLLLSGDIDSNEVQLWTTHIDHCQQCQDRLTAKASDEQGWQDISAFLREGYKSDRGISHEQRSQTRAFVPDLNFLEKPPHPELLGQLGRYQIEKVIGCGGMGIVLKGHDTELNRPVAVKVLAAYLANSGAARQRFAREGRAAAAIVHEHVVGIHNVETQTEVPYLVMQYIPGDSLQTRVDRQGPLTVTEILRIGMQAAAGLSAAHAQGVVHRDIKPSNILLEQGVDRAMLTDFGLARAADDATLTRSGIIAGTPHYMSPEQASGLTIDHRSDLFSLGALLYFMATGHPPFRAEQPLAVLNRICNDRHRPVWENNADIPDDLSDVINQLLQKKPEKRFATAAQVQEALRQLLEKSQQPGAFRRRTPIRRWLNNHKTPLISSLLMAGLLALVGINWYLAKGPTQPPFVLLESDQTPEEVTSKSPQPVFVAPRNPFDVEAATMAIQFLDIQPSQQFAADLLLTQQQLDQLETMQSESVLSSPTSTTNPEWTQELDEIENSLNNLEQN